MKFLGAVLLLSSAASGEIVDRVAVAIDSQVVTESALRRHIRLDAYLRRVPVDFSPEARRQAAERLVDQALIQKEMTLIRYPLPDSAEASKQVEQIRESRKQNDGAFRAELARYGFTEEDLRQEIIWQLTLLRFIDFRFRPGVQVGDAEIKKYYDEEFKPKQSEAPPLDEVASDIARILTARKLNDALSQWLAQMRASTRIHYFPEAFE